MKEKYIAPTTSARALEVSTHLLTGSGVHVEVPGGGTPDTGDDGLPEVKEFNFNMDGFDESPWID